MSELIRYFRLHWVQKPSSSQKNTSSVFVSLTTTPERIRYLRPTIASLHDQSLLPRAIHLYLPKLYRGKRAYDMPDFLKKWPLVKVINVAEDLGPATKWYYAMQDTALADNPIVVLDDDQIYHHNMIRHYHDLSRKFPDLSQTLFGWNVPTSMDHQKRQGFLAGKVNFFRSEKLVTDSVRVDCFQGTSSYMLPINKPKITFSQMNDFGEFIFADDILLSGLLAQQKIPIYVSPLEGRFIRMNPIRKKTYKSLLETKNQDSRLNNHLYDYFKKDWASLNQVT